MGIKKRRSGGGKRKQRGFVRTGETSSGSGESTGAASSSESTGEGTGAERVRVLPPLSENRVEVDAAKIESEMAAVADAADAENTGIPVSSSAAAAGAAEPVPSSWAPICPAVVQVLDLFVCPNWKLREEERTALEESLAPVLDDLFPGGVGDARWAPYFRLAFVVGGVALSRLDRETGRFPPLRVQADEDAKAKEASERNAAADAAERAAMAEAS
jgi:hypothetical protein